MDRLWAVVLAGGDGTRVLDLTRGAAGEPVPRQYCTFGTGEAMVCRAVRRASALVPLTRILVVVAESHRTHWSRALAELPPENVIAQPRNRGTAAGLLLPVLDVFLRRDRDARFLVLPADHHVARESVLHRALFAAARCVRGADSPLVLLGMTPEDDDSEYGWIVPGGGPTAGLRRVLSFVEKPDEATHHDLVRLGGLASSFILAAKGPTLLGLYEDALPGLLGLVLPVVLAGLSREAIDALYERIPSRDFSRAVLERCVESLSVLTVPPCGWSDLGTPARQRRFLAGRRNLVRRLPAGVPLSHSSSPSAHA